MRHLNKKITLGRTAAPRKALLKNLAESLIVYEKITTTKAKARAVKSLVERLITKSKVNTLTTRRLLISKLYTKNAVNKLLEQLGPRYLNRAGGYTRTTLLKNRKGDGAEEAVVEFV
jgi:large subunit ribosomal protein L17